MRYGTTYENRHCPACNRETKHMVTDCYTDNGTYTGQVVRCFECPIET